MIINMLIVTTIPLPTMIIKRTEKINIMKVEGLLEVIEVKEIFWR